MLKDTGALIGLMGFQRHASGEGEDIFYLLSEDAPDRRVGFDPNCIEVGLHPVQVVGVLDKPPEVTNLEALEKTDSPRE